MRVRTRGAHHQKFVVIRYADDPTRDVAYVGGIDLCHGRRDDENHHGDPQAVEIAKAYGPTPAWHDVQVAIQGPAVHDVETTFRERWEDSTPLTVNPGRLLSSLVHREDLSPEPLSDQAPPPPPRPDGHDVVQIAPDLPGDLPQGLRLRARGRALGDAGQHQGDRAGRAPGLRRGPVPVVRARSASTSRAPCATNPDLRLVVVLPMVPDREGRDWRRCRSSTAGRWRCARSSTPAATGSRSFGLSNEAGLPIYVHSKTCVIDHRWASVGSDNLNRRSWTSDSEIACAVVDDRGEPGAPAPEDSFPAAAPRPSSPSTSAATTTRCRRTRTSSSTRWSPAPTRSTSGTPGAAATGERACARCWPTGGHAASHRSPARADGPSSRDEPGDGAGCASRDPIRGGRPRGAAATRSPAATGGPRAHRGAAALGTAAVRPAVRPGRPARPGEGN